MPPEPGSTGRRRLQSGAATLGLDLTADHVSTLMRFLELLQRWNRTYNLTAVRDADDMVTTHLLDCLAVVPALRRRAAERRSDLTATAPQPWRLLDVGSGGGLPGAVLAALEPGWELTCVDTVGKKTAFIQQAAAQLGLPNLHARHSRVEALQVLQPFDLITARAFASLPDLVRWTRHLLAPGGCWMAMKGQDPIDERRSLPSDIDVFHVEPVTVPGLDAQRCLVWMRPAIG